MHAIVPPAAAGAAPDIDRLRALLAERQPGHCLPQPFYTDPAVFQADIEAVFARDWVFAGNECEVREPGDYLLVEFGTDSIIVLRGRDRVLRAFHNTCRHRGSRICSETRGHVVRLVCPYHHWAYGLDGSLQAARQMPPDFDRAAHGLMPVRLEIVCGMIFVAAAGTPPDLAPFRDAVTPYIAPHQPSHTKVAHTETIIQEANWKLVIENNRECYHCIGNHPELLATLVEFAMPDDPRSTATFQALMDKATARWNRHGLPHRPVDGGPEMRCIRLPFHEGAVSFTLDGSPGCRRLLGDLTDPDLGSVRMYRAPSTWNHFLADHILHFQVRPLAVDRTALRTTWLVHEDAVEGVDYDIGKLTAVWHVTNEQDKRLAEINQRGIASRAYRPGPYAPSEFMLVDFTNWYASRIAAYCDAQSD